MKRHIKQIMEKEINNMEIDLSWLALQPKSVSKDRILDMLTNKLRRLKNEYKEYTEPQWEAL